MNFRIDPRTNEHRNQPKQDLTVNRHNQEIKSIFLFSRITNETLESDGKQFKTKINSTTFLFCFFSSEDYKVYLTVSPIFV